MLSSKMNKKQFAYQFGRGFYNNADTFFVGMTGGLGYTSIEQFTQGNSIAGTFFGVASAYAGFYAFLCGTARYLLHKEDKPLQEQKEKYPFESAESIVIDDKKGLEHLLQVTAMNGISDLLGMKKEWGTVLKAHPEPSKRVVIDDLLEPQTAKELGFVGEGKKTSLRLFPNKIIDAGYNGYQHYHPMSVGRWFGARNFSISQIDRYSPAGWINLLTFNMPEGPEIVGFNRNYTYIPTDRSKRQLVRATPKQIMKYLSEKATHLAT